MDEIANYPLPYGPAGSDTHVYHPYTPNQEPAKAVGSALQYKLVKLAGQIQEVKSHIDTEHQTFRQLFNETNARLSALEDKLKPAPQPAPVPKRPWYKFFGGTRRHKTRRGATQRRTRLVR